jgi:hypothetical protein
MVTAILPSLTDENSGEDDIDGSRPKSPPNPRHSATYSVESELTITPERYTRTISNDFVPQISGASNGEAAQSAKPSELAGYVGVFTGAGAVVALVLFLPLPAKFGEREGVTPKQAVTNSFYVVGAVALVVALFVFVGLRNLKGEDGKGWKTLLNIKKDDDGTGIVGFGRSTRKVRRCLAWLARHWTDRLIEGRALPPSDERLRAPRRHRLQDRPGLSRRLRRKGVYRCNLLVHSSVHQHFLHRKWFLPRLAK